MRKAIHYKVSGVVEIKPTNLPEGLNVEEVQVDLPKASVDIRAIHGGSSVRITEYDLDDTHYDGPGMLIPGKGIFEGSEVRKLRDFLNLVLEESTKVRVLRDREGDVWFELSPDQFTLGGSDGDTNALANAKRKVADETGYRNWTFDQINGHDYFGPAKFIENVWE